MKKGKIKKTPRFKSSTEVFKVQLSLSEESVLIYNRNRSILIEDNADRYEEKFLERLRRNGKAYVIMQVHKGSLHFLGYTSDKEW